jgi:hypothetical protein
MQKMFVEAVKWAMALVEADLTPLPLPTTRTHDGQ